MATSAGSDSVIRATVWVCACVWLCVGVQGGRFDNALGRHNITEGRRRGIPPFYSDMLLIYDIRNMPGSWMRVQSVDICYPRPALDTARKFSITAFNVTSYMPPGYAFVTQGGVNWGKLCLHLKTPRGHGSNFKVEIWGFYIN